MTTGVEKPPPAMLWTPWGGQRILQPGEKFAALRRMVRKLQAERKGNVLRKQPAN
jgi:hypothetical protein